MERRPDNYRAAFEDATEPFLIWDAGGCMLEVNRAACRCFGYSREELRGMMVSELFTSSEFLHNQAVGQNSLDLGQIATGIACLKKDGSAVLTEVCTSNTVWHGKAALFSICRPLSGNRGDDTLLGESESRLRAITDSTKDAIVMMDAKGLVSFWNPAAERIFGYTADEALGRNLHAFLAPSRYHQAHAAAFERFKQTGEGNAIDSTLALEAHHRDGNEISIELSLSKLQVLGAWHTIGIIRDITERKKAEEELKESEARFRALHDASFGGIGIHDQGRILDCNQGLSTITGYGRDELVGMDGLQLIAPAWRPLVIEKIRSGYESTYEVEGLRKDGTIYPLSLRGSNIPYKGRVVRVTEFRDISERKQAERERKHLEEQLVQAQKMEAIGTLAGGIAHDFNNILGAILGYVELSRKATPDTSPAAKFLDKALQGVHRATLLVNQILAFSRQVDSKRVPLQIAPIIKEAIKLLRPLLPSTISITQQVQEETRSILADPTQIHQILMNLCTNAYHAMEQSGGILTIALRNADLGPEDLQQYPGVEAGQFAILTIGDTGPGIPDEIRDKIFNPYFTTKTVGKGSGMGLAIVHGIVKNYGGFISLDSEPDAGAWFHIHLPAVEQAPFFDDATDQAIPGGNERILLIDDEEIVADMGRAMLEYLGYQVMAFNNSLEALSAFLNSPLLFDLVITDQTMPDMTGIDLAQRMLAIRSDLPIIICTGYSSIISKEQAQEMGIRGFAMKPLTLKDISTLIRKVIDEK